MTYQLTATFAKEVNTSQAKKFGNKAGFWLKTGEWQAMPVKVKGNRATLRFNLPQANAGNACQALDKSMRSVAGYKAMTFVKA